MTQGWVPLVVGYGYFGVLYNSLVIICFLWFWYTACLRDCIWGWVFGCKFGLLVLLWSEWSSQILSWQFPEDLAELAHHAWEEELVFVSLHNLLISHPIRAGSNWSLMAFSSCSNKSLVSSTVLWKSVHLKDNPLVDADYAAWGSSCVYFESNWKSFTQPSTLFLMNCCKSFNELFFSEWLCPNYWSKVCLPW